VTACAVDLKSQIPLLKSSGGQTFLSVLGG
jgi:hypothetical protein